MEPRSGDRLEDYRKKMRDMRMPVGKARQRIVELKVGTALEDHLHNIYQAARGFHVGNEPTAAVYILAMITERLSAFLEPWRTCAEWEDLCVKVAQLEGHE